MLCFDGQLLCVALLLSEYFYPMFVADFHHVVTSASVLLPSSAFYHSPTLAYSWPLRLPILGSSPGGREGSWHSHLFGSVEPELVRHLRTVVESDMLCNAKAQRPTRCPIASWAPYLAIGTDLLCPLHDHLQGQSLTYAWWKGWRDIHGGLTPIQITEFCSNEDRKWNARLSMALAKA